MEKLTAKTPLDLIAFTPLAIGFTPTESVAMLTFGPVSFHARVDLGLDQVGQEGVAGALVEPCVRHGVTGVVFVIYTEADIDAARSQFSILYDRFTGADINVIDGLLVSGGRWESFTSGHSGDADISTHPFTVQGIADGRVTAPSREALGELIAMRDTLTSVPAIDQGTDLTSLHIALINMIERRAAEGRFTDDELGTMLASLDVDDLRDTVIKFLARNYTGRSRAFAALFVDAAARAPRTLRARALSVHAFAAYLSGDGASAWISADAATAIDPHNSLADIVSALLTQATPPAEAARIFQS